MRIIGWRMLCASLDGATRVIDRMLRAYYRTIWLGVFGPEIPDKRPKHIAHHGVTVEGWKIATQV